jgi:Spy/CpxP family protein refolding chaperone
MRRLLPLLLAFVATSIPVFSQNAPATKPAAAPAPTSPADAAKTMENMRADLQAQRADLMAKNITLSAAEAAKFWPLFEKFQAEQNVIIDAQLKALKEYSDKYQTLDDAAALAYVESLLKRDDAMTAVRRKWLPEFRKVVSGGTAARVIQIDRRLSNASQVMISSQVPLVR